MKLGLWWYLPCNGWNWWWWQWWRWQESGWFSILTKLTVKAESLHNQFLCFHFTWYKWDIWNIWYIWYVWYIWSADIYQILTKIYMSEPSLATSSFRFVKFLDEWKVTAIEIEKYLDWMKYLETEKNIHFGENCTCQCKIRTF